MKNYMIVMTYTSFGIGGSLTATQNAFVRAAGPLTQAVIEEWEKQIKAQGGFNSLVILNVIPLESGDDKLRTALRDLVTRCDGDEGVRPDGSNIDTYRAHAALGDFS